MNDSDERHDVPMSNPLTDSPPSVKDDKNEGSDVFLYKYFICILLVYFRSDSSHLDTELLPSDENTNCPHCHGEFRKVHLKIYPFFIWFSLVCWIVFIQCVKIVLFFN